MAWPILATAIRSAVTLAEPAVCFPLVLFENPLCAFLRSSFRRFRVRLPPPDRYVLHKAPVCARTRLPRAYLPPSPPPLPHPSPVRNARVKPIVCLCGHAHHIVPFRTRTTYASTVSTLRRRTPAFIRRCSLSRLAVSTMANETRMQYSATCRRRSLLLDFSVSSDMQSSPSAGFDVSSPLYPALRDANLCLSPLAHSSPLFHQLLWILTSRAVFAPLHFVFFLVLTRDMLRVETVYCLRGSHECARRGNYCKLQPQREGTFRRS